MHIKLAFFLLLLCFKNWKRYWDFNNWINVSINNSLHIIIKINIQTNLFKHSSNASSLSLKHTHHWHVHVQIQTNSHCPIPHLYTLFYEKIPPRYNAPSSFKKKKEKSNLPCRRSDRTRITPSLPPFYIQKEYSERSIWEFHCPPRGVVERERESLFPLEGVGDAEESRITPIVVFNPTRGLNTPGQVALCVFRRGRGGKGRRGEARCTGARGRVKCIMWNGEWIGSAREGEESFEQAPLCAGKLGPFFFERDERRNVFLFDRNCWYAGRNEDTTILFFFFQVERFRIFFLFFPLGMNG